jgi:alpha-L-arabinofuranosidase
LPNFSRRSMWHQSGASQVSDILIHSETSRRLVQGLHSLIYATMLLLAGMAPASAASVCPPVDTIQRGSEVSFDVLDTRTLHRAFALGFNLEWKTFQTELWRDEAHTVDENVVRMLAQFPQLVYRYPGGSVANFLDLNLSLGDRKFRPEQRAVTWSKPEGMRFGLSEYLGFLDEIKGRSWLVVNLFGRLEGVQSIEVLAPKWEALAQRLKMEGAPERIELGNELYLDRYAMTPESYAERVNAAATVFRRYLPDARFVVGLSDFDGKRYTKERYNHLLLKNLKLDGIEFAQHSYYDGPPGGPPVPNRLRAVCRTIQQIRESGVSDPVVWITEHARWPGGKTSDPGWKELWPLSNNLEAAISVADYVIASSTLPEVRGAFLHSLSGSTGPWAFYMRNDGVFYPSALASMFGVLYELASSDIIPTRTITTKSQGHSGEYDTRGIVLRMHSNDHWALLAINRSNHAIDARVMIPSLSSKKVSARKKMVGSTSANANNSIQKQTLLEPSMSAEDVVFNEAGAAHISLKPYSISFIEFIPSRPDRPETKLQ